MSKSFYLHSMSETVVHLHCIKIVKQLAVIFTRATQDMYERSEEQQKITLSVYSIYSVCLR